MREEEEKRFMREKKMAAKCVFVKENTEVRREK